jgi:acyl-CoA thioesterase-1
MKMFVAAAAALTLVGLSAPASSSSPTSSVVVLGDSVPYGSACGCTPFGPVYARMLSERLHRTVTSTNLARSGATTGSLQAQLGTASVQSGIRGATTVVIMIGANDFAGAFRRDQLGTCAGGCYGSTAQGVKLALSAIVDRVQQIHRSAVSVVLLDYWNVVEDGAVARQDYGPSGVLKSLNATSYANAAIHAAAVSRHTGFGSTRIAFRGDNDDLDPTPNLAPDGDHPNAKGHQVISHLLGNTRPSG